MKINWINLLHFYQPPTADNETIIEATEVSYLRIINALKRNPRIKFTFNIAGCLAARWDKLGYRKLIADIKKLTQRGQIELTGSAAYHPILPLLPLAEVKRQIELNDKILKKYFTAGARPKGFFIPEATYQNRLARLIKAYGYGWIVLDEIAAGGKITDNFNFNKLYSDLNSGLKICFRSRRYSKSYVPKTIFELIKLKQPQIVVTATDAELYGLRHADQSATFEKLLKRPELNCRTVSQYLIGLKEKRALKPRASSWESTEQELRRGQPYHLWHDSRNKIQLKLWQLAKLAIKTVNKYSKDENYAWARQHLDKGLSSCTFWWASARDFRLFGPISWNPDEIERGSNELIRSVRALADQTTRQTKIKAEKLYIAIKKMVWQKHWRYYWNK